MLTLMGKQKVSVLADRLKESRIRQGLSQSALAERLDISRIAVQKWERGEAGPSMERLPQVAGALCTTQSYLLGETDEWRSADYIASESRAMAAIDLFETRVREYVDRIADEMRKGRTQEEIREILADEVAFLERYEVRIEMGEDGTLETIHGKIQTKVEPPARGEIGNLDGAGGQPAWVTDLISAVRDVASQKGIYPNDRADVEANAEVGTDRPSWVEDLRASVTEVSRSTEAAIDRQADCFVGEIKKMGDYLRGRDQDHETLIRGLQDVIENQGRIIQANNQLLQENKEVMGLLKDRLLEVEPIPVDPLTSATPTPSRPMERRHPAENRRAGREARDGRNARTGGTSPVGPDLEQKDIAE